MPELVTVSKVENLERLKSYLEELYQKKRYAEMAQAVGMHSILIRSEFAIEDQADLFRFVLDLIKHGMQKARGKNYSAWYTGFARSLDTIVMEKRVITDKSAADILASHRAAFGPFKSLDDFFFWALEDRRLPLGQIAAYIEKTA